MGRWTSVAALVPVLSGVFLVCACDRMVPESRGGSDQGFASDGTGDSALSWPVSDGRGNEEAGAPEAGAAVDARPAADGSPMPDSAKPTTCGNKVCDPGEDCFSCAADCPCGAGKTYYVATSGNDSSSGTSLTTPWKTITHAAATAQAGDTVFIKAGNYGHEHVVVKSSGTAKSPIAFIGYRTTPGDNPRPATKPGDPLDGNVMPLINGQDGTGAGFTVSSKSYVWFKNLQVTLYAHGFYVTGSSYIRLDNIFAHKFGNSTHYTGLALHFKTSDHCELRNSVVTDGNAEGISMYSCSYFTVEDCQVHSVDGDQSDGIGRATDYYIVIYNGHHNVVRNCLAQNHHATLSNSHYGHGIGVKHGYSNKIIGCTARGFAKAIYVSDAEWSSGVSHAYDNEIIGCTVYDDGLSKASSSSALVIRDGAYNNTFRDCRIKSGVEAGIYAWNSEGKGGGHDNTFSNIIFEGVGTAIALQVANNNVFRNLVVYKASTVVSLSGTCTGNTIHSSIITGTSKYGSTSCPATYSDFFQNSFSMPSGTGNLSSDPLFADAAQGDFHLKSKTGRWDGKAWVKDSASSPCIDAGDPAAAFSAEPQPNGGRIDMGAYGNTGEASHSP